MTAPSLPAPSLTPPQMVTPNLQQFFPQATRQSLLGPPPVGVPMNPSQLSHSGRNSQKQARTPSTTPNHKVSRALGGAREESVKGCPSVSRTPCVRAHLAFRQVMLPHCASVCKMKVAVVSSLQTSNTSVPLMGL